MNATVSPTLHLDKLEAVVFDLDGVLTDTASLHERAWTATFGKAFEEIVHERGLEIRTFSTTDYRRFVDGRLRLEGVKAVLSDRNLALDDGLPEDAPGSGSAWAIANAKDARFLELLHELGSRPFPSSIRLLRRLRRAGTKTAVVSASRHCDEVLASGDIADLFDAEVDGWAAAAMHLAGKPEPDTFIEAARRLGARPDRSAIVEDAVAGVTAGRGGGFGYVVGVDRDGTGAELAAAGAHVVVRDLGELHLAGAGPSTDDWHLEQNEHRPRHEGIRETLCTLGNGYVATRGARPDAVADSTHYPGTYFAGIFDRSSHRLGDQRFEREATVNAPNWLPLRFAMSPGATTGDSLTVVEDRGLRLDLRRGLLERRYIVGDDDRRTSVLERRLVSMATPHLAAIELTLVAQNWSGSLQLCSELDGAVADSETLEERLLASRHLEVTGGSEIPPDLISVVVRTGQSEITLAEAARTTLTEGDGDRIFTFEGGRVAHTFTFRVERQARVTIEKVVGLFTSRDFAISEPTGAARDEVRRAGSFDQVLYAHEHAWARLWDQVGIELGREHPNVGRTINLHLFHLLQVVSPHVIGRDVGVPARGLHGEGYLGHIFWDEVFILPMLSLRLPDVARSLLSYRYRRLDTARDAARAVGAAGAMFPWQSGSDGRDETPAILYNPRSKHWIPDRSGRQRHVGLAVAFNFWQHFQATGNIEHLAAEGAVVLLEVARFFSSLTCFDDSLGRHRIKGLMGPDEFHDGYPWSEDPGIDDNAYTNVMAAWLFTRVAEVVDLLGRAGQGSVLESLEVSDTELDRFDMLSRTLYVPFLDNGVIAQFDGYDRLEPIDLAPYRAKYGDIGRLDLILEAEGDTVRRYQVAKQADVLMLLYLFSAEELRDVFARLAYELRSDVIRRTVAYYTERVVHGSSLSRIVHAWVASRGDRQASWRYFSEALALDIHDSQGGTTREGIHLGAMAGTVDLLTRCYTGLEVRKDALWLNPRLPSELGRLAFAFQYRGLLLRLDIDHRRVAVEARGGPATTATILVQGRPYALGPGDRLLHELS